MTTISYILTTRLKEDMNLILRMNELVGDKRHDIRLLSLVESRTRHTWTIPEDADSDTLAELAIIQLQEAHRER